MNSSVTKFVVLFLTIFLSSLAFAGLSVDPSVMNVSAQPNSEFTNEYLVTSSYDKPMVLVVRVSDGYSYSGNKDVKAEDWLTFEKDRYNIKSGETVKVPFKCKISQAMLGSVSAKISFSVEQSSMINLAVTVPLYVTVKGTETVDFAIDSLSLSQNDKDGNVSYKMTVKNNGNVHIRHHGSIDVYSKNKKKLIKSFAIQETVPTYAESSRTFYDLFLTKDSLPKGKYVAVFKISDLNKSAEKEIAFKILKSGKIKILN